MSVAKQRFVLRSADRVSGNSGDFKLKTENPIEPGLYRLQNAIIPNTIYNITAGYNDKFYFREGASTYRTATMPEGFYTSSNIAAAVQTQMNAVSSGYTVTLSTLTNRLTIANASSFTINSTSDGSLPNSCAPLLGFGTSASSSGTSITAGACINLAFPLSLLVEINQIATVRTMKNVPVYGTFLIPLKENSNDIVVFSNNADYESFLRIDSNTVNFDVKLRYLDGTLLSLNGADFELYFESA